MDRRIFIFLLNLSITINYYSAIDLKYYEIFNKFDVNVKTKRSIHQLTGKKLNILYKNVSYTLHVYPSENLFSKDFSAYNVKAGYENYEKINVDKNCYFKGKIIGKPDSHVRLFMNGQSLNGQMSFDNQLIMFEPLSNYANDKSGESIIIYDRTSLRKNPLDYHSYGKCTSTIPNVKMKETVSYRKKRQTNNEQLNTCAICLIADFRYFDRVGGKSEQKTIETMISIMDQVDNIYRSHTFKNYKDIGFEILRVLVHTQKSDNPDHYNADKAWTTDALLTQFSKSDWSKCCLAHLFTAIAFSDGVLGLGWIASPRVGDPGGICSTPISNNYYNTAWSTALNKNNKRIMTMEHYIVVAHELGHNFGSQHDTESTECTPPNSAGGNFIMYTYSISGYEINNKFFSPCSITSMAKVLDVKKGLCFKAKSKFICGNNKVEIGFEECDSGTLTLDDKDPCCAPNCQLRPNKKCSDADSKCCKNCFFESSGVVCIVADVQNITCNGASFCSGTSNVCPPPNHKKDGSKCIGGGTCKNGICLSFCESIGKLSCSCDKLETSCKMCCKADVNSVCDTEKNLFNDVYDLSDGSSCIIGTCEKGVCIKQIRKVTERLWNFIETITINKALLFMKENVVASTLFFSLILYIPIAIIIAIVDYKLTKKDEKDVAWRNIKNDQLIFT